MKEQQKTGIIIAVVVIIIFLAIIITLTQDVPHHSIQQPLSPVPKDRVIVVYGDEPGNTQPRQQNISNSELVDIIRPDLQPYLYPEGPVIGYGWGGMDGSIVVMIYENWTLNLTTINQIHERIAARGKEFGVDPVRCRFVWEGIPILDSSAEDESLLSSGSGKPCTSNEAWHTKGDEIGFWSGGILVDRSMTDDEVYSLLAQHNISNPEDVKITAPHHIGYYLSVNETRDRFLLDDLRTFRFRWNVSFSSPEIVFLLPMTKARDDNVEIPVFLSYSVRMKEALLYQNLLDRGVPLNEAKVVDLGYLSSDVAGKEKVLQELNSDPRVLFTFKEYLQGDIC